MTVSPTIISPQEAAAALGVRLADLARTLDGTVQDRLTQLGRDITQCETTTLEQFDDEVADIRRLFESSVACWKVVEDERSNRA